MSHNDKSEDDGPHMQQEPSMGLEPNGARAQAVFVSE